MKITIKVLSLSTLLLPVALLQGCATISGNSSQNLSIETVTKTNELVTGAQCKLSSDKGTWYVTTPNTVMVQKSGDDLVILCDKKGQLPGTVRAVSKVGAAMFGNAILGGGIGAIIDHSKGTAYNYPPVIKVTMGESHTIPARKQTIPKPKKQ